MTAARVVVLAFVALRAPRADAQSGSAFVTDDPDTPKANRWEIHTSSSLQHRARSYSFSIFDLDLNYGLTDSVQVKYETSWDVVHADGETPEHAAGGWHFGVKWRFVDRALAASAHPQLDVDPETGATQVLLPVEAKTTLGPFDLVAEVGYDFMSRAEDRVVVGVVVSHDFGDVSAGVEARSGADSDLQSQGLVFNVGTIVDLSRDRALLVSIGRSPRRAASGEPDLLYYVGIQFRP